VGSGPEKAEGRHVAPIIVRRRARVHEAHHGGAWKVAYADFGMAAFDQARALYQRTLDLLRR
jgi:hypothetical protein